MQLTELDQFQQGGLQTEQDHCLSALLMNRLLSVTERVHHHLADMLHDDVLQIGCQIERLLLDLQASASLPMDVYEPLTEAVHLSNMLVRYLRGIVTELYPPPLQIVGLQVSLQMLLQGLEQRTRLRGSLQCDAQTECLLACLGHEQKMLLYNIAREAIMNAVKHAQATMLSVALCSDGVFLHMAIQDDGNGFVLTSIGELLAAGHLGLASLQGRVQQIRGTLQIKTAPGCGTTLVVQVPIDDCMEEESRC